MEVDIVFKDSILRIITHISHKIPLYIKQMMDVRKNGNHELDVKHEVLVLHTAMHGEKGKTESKWKRHK